MKLLIKAGLVLLGLVLLGAALLVAFLRSTLPPHDGELQFAQLDAPVTIARDAWGVPHIEAETEHDLHFALGVAHAQDRLWQLDIHRRIAAGRLAEILGPEAAQQDIFLRTLSLYDRAEKAFGQLPEEAQAMFRAYADGVNAYVAKRRHPLPPEYHVLGADFAPFTPVDALSWLKVMALDLGKNYARELSRLGLSDRLTAAQLEQFYPVYPGSLRPPLPDLRQLYDGAVITPAAVLAPEVPDTNRGSNNWVVDGQWTKSGKPILANDPHLSFNTPGLWYLAHLKLGDRHIIGVTIPGLPMVVLGRNNRIAWGFTNTGPDTQDLYLEKLVPGAGYLTPDGPEAFVEREELIKIKGAPDQTITVRETRHGPVISDAMDSVRPILSENSVLALRWTALDPDDVSASTLQRMLYVDTVEQLHAALADYVGPQQNIVFADVDGNIGYTAPARIPVRGPRNITHGLVPAPGWKPGFDWQGFADPAQLPQVHNPADGVLVTANQQVVPKDFPVFLSHEWALPYRHDRIRTLIEASRDHDLDTMGAIQMDRTSAIAEDLLPLFQAHVSGLRHQPVLQALADWDRVMVADAAEPLIFAAWHRRIIERLIADELGDRFPAVNGAKTRFLIQVLTNQDDMATWCDDVQTAPEESCGEIVTTALDQTMGDLTEQFGSDWRRWRWGELHRVRMPHRPLSQIAALRRFFEIGGPIGGGVDTVNVAGGSFNVPHINRAGAGYRGLFDLSDLDRSRYVIATGQSGHPLSKHYDDLFPLWRDGGMIEIPARMPEPDAASILRLTPRVLKEN
ncbi:MAG: penicillin acylase family protein [Rhodothalassiaceae bacterium]